MSNTTKSFADKYAKKGGNSLSQLLKEKKEKQMPSTAQSLSKNAAINNSKADLIYLVKGIDKERPAWYYVLVERLKLSLFLKALNDDIIHLENYGKILFSAYGEEPPKDITDKVKKEYDIK
jgi:hypothetical protein